jgi:hypothetical protein
VSAPPKQSNSFGNLPWRLGKLHLGRDVFVDGRPVTCAKCGHQWHALRSHPSAVHPTDFSCHRPTPNEAHTPRRRPTAQRRKSKQRGGLTAQTAFLNIAVLAAVAIGLAGFISRLASEISVIMAGVPTGYGKAGKPICRAQKAG